MRQKFHDKTIVKLFFLRGNALARTIGSQTWLLDDTAFDESSSSRRSAATMSMGTILLSRNRVHCNLKIGL